jgi:hypothetical protein
MPQMSNSQARVIDPILSTVAQGYSQNSLVASALFPSVTVTQRGGKILQFGKESFMLYNGARSPGENTKRLRFGYLGASYSLADYSLEGMVPAETEQEAMAVPGIDLAAQAINVVSSAMATWLEKASADVARTAASYSSNNKTTLSGTSQWSDFTNGVSDPIKDVEAAKNAVRSQIGKKPNTMIVGSAVMAYLRQHPKIVDRIKYTGRDVATAELLAALFGVERVLEGESIYATDAGVITDIWGKDVVLAYTNIGNAQSYGLPSYGYTYTLQGYPQVEEPYQDRSAKSWVYPVTRVEAPVMAAASAGFLIVNAVA